MFKSRIYFYFLGWEWVRK